MNPAAASGRVAESGMDRRHENSLDDWLDDALGSQLQIDRSPAEAWAASGCASLSGWPAHQRDQTARAAALFADQAAAALSAIREQLGARVAEPGAAAQLDGAALLAQRAAHTGATRAGAISCNGTTRFVRTADGWVSFSLSRPDDTDLLPACFEADLATGTDPWEFVSVRAATMSSVHIRDRATMLGLSCAVPGEHLTTPLSASDIEVFPRSRRSPGPVRVVDLSSLWAGPLCAHLLRRYAGAVVTTVEDPTRPDGARTGAPSFYASLHAGHQLEPIDLRSTKEIERLKDLLRSADVVVTAARPRAIAQLGIDPGRFMSETSVAAWISITGFGPTQPLRIGFGDDAAVAGGFWGNSDRGPVFAADALADPLTGLAAAAIAAHAIATGTRVHAQVSLAGVAARAARLNPGPALNPDELRLLSGSHRAVTR